MLSDMVVFAGISKPMDVVYIIDTSKGMTLQDIEQLKSYLISAVDEFKISEKDVRVGFVVNSGVSNQDGNQNVNFLGLDKGSSKDQVKTFIKNIQKLDTSRDLVSALNFADLSKFRVRRENGKKVELVTFVVAKQPFPVEPLKNAVIRLRNKPDKLVFVGSGTDIPDDVSIGDLKVEVINLDSTQDIPDLYPVIFKVLATTRGILS